MVGFIGLGHMGFCMLENLCVKDSFNGEKVGVYNRTARKCDYFVENYGAKVFSEIDDVVANCDIIVSSLHGELQNMVLSRLTNRHFISVSNALEIKTMEKFYSGPISRIMPTISMDGYTLVTHNELVSEKNKELVLNLFSSISTVLECSERDLEILTLVTSSGPGLYSALLLEFQKSFLEETSIRDEDIAKMINSTLKSTLERLDTGDNYVNIIETVATKGGLTEVGVNIIKNECSNIFSNLIKDSLAYNVKQKAKVANKMENK